MRQFFVKKLYFGHYLDLVLFFFLSFKNGGLHLDRKISQSAHLYFTSMQVYQMGGQILKLWPYFKLVGCGIFRLADWLFWPVSCTFGRKLFPLTVFENNSVF